jgi:ribonuclease P protein component
VAWLADPPGASLPPRVAYAVGRRVGGAVARNRVRRRLRSLAREAALPGGAWLVGAGAAAAPASRADLSSWFAAAVASLVGGP